MFRFFLRKRILEGEDPQALSGPTSRSLAQSQLKNRRVLERFPVDHKHLTVMNEQDILLIREMSVRGFCAQVSERGFERMKIGDVYEGRIRYLDNSYELEGRVAWKQEGFVGFELVTGAPETNELLQRLVHPMEVAMSLSEIDANFMQNQEGIEKIWLHGENGNNLVIWRTEDGISGWELSFSSKFVSWSRSHGFTSGVIHHVDDTSVLGGFTGGHKQKDPLVDETKKTFAMDVLAALQSPIRDELVQTISFGE